MKSVLLLSGGIDSAVLAYQLADEGHRVHALTFNYGQTHRREISYARDIATQLYFRHSEIHVARVFSGSGDALTGEGSIPTENSEAVVVPGRNALFLSYALAVAMSEGAGSIYIGATKDDAEVFPDCRPEFIGAFQAMAAAAAADDLQPYFVRAPWIDATKEEVVRVGNALCVPWKSTYSCYRGKAKHCGRCGPCTARSEALGEDDPTDYHYTPLTQLTAQSQPCSPPA